MSQLALRGLAPTAGRGRPEVTSHAEIEAAAFDLFHQRGFEATTLEAIAERLGVGRRTLFRYYRSKNDIPWGRFDDDLGSFRRLLAQAPNEASLWETISSGVVGFNTYPSSVHRSHRERMQLILRTPALQAHSTLRYAEWRAVISQFVAARTGAPESSLLAQTAANVSLALALTAYEAWLDDELVPLTDLLRKTMSTLGALLGS